MIKVNNEEIPNSKDNVIFYHNPCLDGITSACIVKQKLDKAKYIGINHGSYDEQINLISSNINKETNIIFLDFAPSAKILFEILEKANHIYIYDHHVSSKLDIINIKHDKLSLFFDMDRSGAGISWDLFNKGKKRPLLIDIIEKIDLETPDIGTNTDDFYNIASYIDNVALYSFDRFCIEMKKLMELNISELSILGKDLRDKQLTSILKILKKSEIRKLYKDDLSFSIVNCDLFNYGRELMPKLFEFNKNVSMVTIWHKDKNDIIRFHIRTKNNIDASKIAIDISKKYGINGGGHKNSAAVRFQNHKFLEFLDDCF